MSTDRLPSGSLTYEPDPAAFWGGRITIDLPVDPPAPRQHILKAAAAQMPVEKHHQGADDWTGDWTENSFDNRADEVDRCVDKVANGHLANATGSSAHIWRGAERLIMPVFLPNPIDERPGNQMPGPFYKEYALPPETYLGHRAVRTLTPDQEDMLAKVVESVRDILPPALQPHVDDIAHLVAQEIPTQTDLLRAYQRTSVPEVLAEYARAGRPEQLSPEHQQAMKRAQLSFPQHAAESLKTSAPAAAATPARTDAGISTRHAFDR